MFEVVHAVGLALAVASVFGVGLVLAVLVETTVESAAARVALIAVLGVVGALVYAKTNRKIESTVAVFVFRACVWFSAKRDATHGRKPSSSVLRLFRWFVRGETRIMVDLSAADISQDARAMIREGQSRLAVKLMVWWQSARCIVPIAWSGLQTMLERAMPFYALLRKLGGH